MPIVPQDLFYLYMRSLHDYRYMLASIVARDKQGAQASSSVLSKFKLALEETPAHQQLCFFLPNKHEAIVTLFCKPPEEILSDDIIKNFWSKHLFPVRSFICNLCATIELLWENDTLMVVGPRNYGGYSRHLGRYLESAWFQNIQAKNSNAWEQIYCSKTRSNRGREWSLLQHTRW